MKDGPIVCVGILVADVVGRPVDDVPQPGRLSLVQEMSIHAGGCAANTATVLARLGLPVEVVGMVGRDPFGAFLTGELQRRGIDTGGVRSHASIGTSATMVMVGSDGERRFVHYIGANAALTLDNIDMALIDRAAVVHVGGAFVLPGLDGEPMAELLARARSAGAITCLDTVWDASGRWLASLAPCLPHVDYFVPSLPEAQALSGESDPLAAARALKAAGTRTVAIKMGSDGCIALGPTGEIVRLPAFDVPAVDTTGAGDAFAAGFIAGVYQGLTLKHAAQLANASGALAVMAVGAAGATRSLAETLAFIDATLLRPG